MSTINWKEKRNVVRASFGWSAVLIDNQGEISHGRVRDISGNGALVYINTKLKVDDQIELAVNIPEFRDGLSAQGTITRVKTLGKDISSFTYALGVRFTRMSSEGLEYFSGNIPSGWRNKIIDEKDLQENANIPGLDQNSGNISKSLQWLVGGTATAVLVMIAISIYQLVFPKSTVSQNDLLLLSESISKELQLVRKASQQQVTTNRQVEIRLTKMKSSSILPDQTEEILSLLNSQALRLQQIEKTLQKKLEISKEAPVDTLSKTGSSTKEAPKYHTVRSGETIFSISRQYGLTVEELLRCNSLSKGTIILSNQKLQITPISSNIPNRSR